jgi:hypothetical protein
MPCRPVNPPRGWARHTPRLNERDQPQRRAETPRLDNQRRGRPGERRHSQKLLISILTVVTRRLRFVSPSTTNVIGWRPSSLLR